jgi:hypothetical protein
MRSENQASDLVDTVLGDLSKSIGDEGSRVFLPHVADEPVDPLL